MKMSEMLKGTTMDESNESDRNMKELIGSLYRARKQLESAMKNVSYLSAFPVKEKGVKFFSELKSKLDSLAKEIKAEQVKLS